MKVLLLPYESDYHNYIHLGKKFQDNGYEVYFLISDFFSVISGDNIIKKDLIKNGFSPEKIYDLEEELKTINKTPEYGYKNHDKSFLAGIEKKLYTGRKLSHLIYCDIYLSGVLHNRDYVSRPQNKEILYLLVEMITKKIQKCIDQVKPDFCFTFGAYNFVRNYSYEYSRSCGIPFFSSFYTRIDKLFSISNSSFIGTMKMVEDEMKKLKSSKEADLHFAEDFIRRLNVKKQAAYDVTNFDYAQDIDKKFSTWENFKPVLYSIKSLPRATWKDRKTRLRGTFAGNYYYLKPFYYSIVFHFKKFIRNFFYHRNRDLHHIDLPKENFIFYSLQTLPEDVVFSQKDLYDEKYNIMRISKNLPVNYKLVVKPHLSMVVPNSAPYPISWYNEINEMHNVIFVSPKLRGVDIIARSKGVAAVSSTTLFEAALMGKPAFSFGDPEYGILDGVFKFNETTFMNTIKSYALHGNNNHKYYIQAIKNKSVDADYYQYCFAGKEVCESPEYKKEFLNPFYRFIVESSKYYLKKNQVE